MATYYSIEVKKINQSKKDELLNIIYEKMVNKNKNKFIIIKDLSKYYIFK